MKSIRSITEKIIMKTTDTLSNSAHEAFDKIASATSHAKDTLVEKSEQLHKAEQHYVKHCRGLVRDNPMKSLGIAAAAGFVLGLLVGNRQTK